MYAICRFFFSTEKGAYEIIYLIFAESPQTLNILKKKKNEIILIGDIDKSMSDSIEIPVEVVASRFLEP
jgi:hypothetical protein